MISSRWSSKFLIARSFLVRDPLNYRPSLVDLLRPSIQTLKHIVIDVDVDIDDVDPLFGIPSELEEMRSNNIIETVTIGILFQTDVYCQQGDDWGRLDEALTAPGWLSLKQVSLVIEFASFSRSDEDDELLEIALRKLPETQFSRLSSSTSISFDFDVINIDFGLGDVTRYLYI